MKRRRVVVTGLGASSAAGAGVGAFWSACVAGRAALRPDSRFQCGAAERPPVGLFPGTLPRDEERGSALALEASREALQDARFGADQLPSLGIVLGSCLGGALETFNWLDDPREADDAARLPFPESGSLCSPASRLAEQYGVTGPVISISSACSSGIGAIAQAAACIRRGETDCMLAGGVDALSVFVLAGFRALGALTPMQVRPFDRRRDGLALGEGAGILVLEEHSRALQRGVPVLAELMGCGTAGDTSPGALPARTADGLVRAISAAFTEAGRGPDSVDFVSAQGTGTPHGDQVEALAIRSAFGEHGSRIAVHSHKPIVGHALGAAGALSAILCVQVLRHGLLPPTINHDEPDAGCDLDCVSGRARSSEVRCALALSSGFASHNAALLLGRR